MSSDRTDLNHPKPAEHSDNEASKMPDRADDDRKQAPNDSRNVAQQDRVGIRV
jgi:hypothetical protein